MEERMPMAGGRPHEVPMESDRGTVPADWQSDPRSIQILATEHWSLLATRSMSWNESFSRTSMFLTSLSTATVALALVGSATGFGPEFILFALVVLSITLFLGLATFVRLIQVNNEDLYWVAGMNRLRGVYARLTPGIEQEFVTGSTLDVPGFALSYAAMQVTRWAPLHFFVTTPGVIGTISSVIAGVVAGLATLQVAPAMTSGVGVGVVVAILTACLCVAYGRRESSRYIARMIRFRGDPESPRQP